MRTELMIGVVTGIEHFMHWRPVKVQRDRCRTQYRVNRCWFMNAAERDRLRLDLVDAGWWVLGDHVNHLCPECVL